MANPEHLAILKQGVEVWNEWKSHQKGRASLAEVKLYRARLEKINFNKVDLRNADLRKVNLSYADLGRADLTEASLSGAHLAWANLMGARLDRANLEGAKLVRSYLAAAHLKGANLRKAELWGTTFSDADLSEACLTEATLGGTIFTGTNFNGVKGLETCRHSEPSAIDFRALQTTGALPIQFLRGVGLPDVLIDYLPSLISHGIQFYSCFISYSAKNQDFANRLYADIQNKGVRCWFAPEDLKIGDPFRQRIDESIRIHDKLLLMLSEHSVNSPWVQDEVEAALERERREGRLVLFPIRIDDAVMQTDKAWAASIRRTRHIGDFSNWKDHDSYQKAFQRLLRDLKATGKNDRDATT